MKVPFIRTPFNYDMSVVSDETALFCDDPSLAVQAERDETDINTIVYRFGLTGHLPQGVRAPSYGDFTGVSDYRSALDLIEQADDAFMSLPAEVRARFQNDAARFVDFCSDERNADEMRSLGLLIPEEVKTPGTGVEPPQVPPAGAA